MIFAVRTGRSAQVDRRAVAGCTGQGHCNTWNTWFVSILYAVVVGIFPDKVAQSRRFKEARIVSQVRLALCKHFIYSHLSARRSIAIRSVITALVLCSQDITAGRRTKGDFVGTRYQTAEQVQTGGISCRIQRYADTIDGCSGQGNRYVWNTIFRTVLNAVCICIFPDVVAYFGAFIRIHCYGYLIGIAHIKIEGFYACYRIHIPYFPKIIGNIRVGLVYWKGVHPHEFLIRFAVIIVINEIDDTVVVQVTAGPVQALTSHITHNVVIHGNDVTDLYTRSPAQHPCGQGVFYQFTGTNLCFVSGFIHIDKYARVVTRIHISQWRANRCIVIRINGLAAYGSNIGMQTPQGWSSRSTCLRSARCQ